MAVYEIRTVEMIEKVYYIGASDQETALKAFEQYEERIRPSNEETLDSTMPNVFYESVELETEMDADYTVGVDLHIS